MVAPRQGKERGKLVRRASVVKQLRQSEKRRIRNRAFHSCVKRKIRLFREQVSQNQLERAQGQLPELQSLLDKAAKKGLFKARKARRLQSRFASSASLTSI